METKTFIQSGLERPVEILIDQWGIPHIYAHTYYDAFYAQGFNAARDRLWQIDLWRRRGLGKLSEVLGSEYIEQDRATRLFLYRGDMNAEWRAYGENAQKIVSSFVAGINAYVEWVEEDRERRPEEFNILGYRPAKWAPEDVVRIRSHGLIRNAQNEVTRAITLRDFGQEAEDIRQRLEPRHQLQIPEGLDLNDITEEIMDVYSLAQEGVHFDGARHTSHPYESNNWVISPEKSRTGRPILANDPHRDLELPSLRYIAHISAPGLDIIGGGEPSLPGISIGHNGKIAFGLTIFSIDQEDVYVYETNPDAPSQYLYNETWEEMEKIIEEIPLKNGKSEHVEIAFTRHGPVIYEDKKNNRAFAVRTVWLEPGTSPYLRSLAYMEAENWDDFRDAMNQWGTPAENQIYADIEGNIGWKAGGITPIRERWDGLLPVPGDGRYEWGGFLDQSNLPSEFNPDRGWIVTANEMNLPAYYPYELGYEWSAPFRAQRIQEFIAGKDQMGVEDCRQLQNDDLSIPARRIIAQLKEGDDRKTQTAVKMLKKWDKVLSKESAAAALFEIWYQCHLQPAIVGQVVSKEAAETIGTGDPVIVLNLIENPDERFGRDNILLSSLRAAIAHTEKLLGPHMEQWRWGDLHQAYFEHPLANIAKDETMNVGPFPRGGSRDTPGMTGYATDHFRQNTGATFSIIIDVGEWDQSRVMNSPGQSGNQNDKHYDDLSEKWAAAENIPLLYSREKIEQVAKERIVLRPVEE